jgi:hypothetical protein
MEILDDIRKVSTQVSDRELTKLRIEEELLISLVTKGDTSLEIKKKAFERIAFINKEQLKLLGHR